ncbi:GATA-domain-containing protein, partial [Trametes sanguinea]
QPPQPSSPMKEFPVFEFTKRKRWADLLITEVSDTLILVLSESCQVWYCGSAVTELLGWRDDELVDGDLIDLMNADDRANFRTAFAESVRSRTEMLAYVRLQCKNEFHVASDLTSAPREVLFEIRGRPHFLPASDEFKCYFAMAQPYPSRNIAMLNTFLELKTENERLQQRVAQLRSQSLALDGPADSFFANSDGFAAPDGGGGSGGGGGGGRPGFDIGTAGLGPELDEDGPRKKAKRLAAEQHVCVQCGRTDSPEWRKGPKGPKTLCNACGLRWAKKSRKPNEAEGGAGASE